MQLNKNINKTKKDRDKKLCLFLYISMKGAASGAAKCKIVLFKKVQKWSKHPYFKGTKWLKTKNQPFLTDFS